MRSCDVEPTIMLLGGHMVFEYHKQKRAKRMYLSAHALDPDPPKTDPELGDVRIESHAQSLCPA